METCIHLIRNVEVKSSRFIIPKRQAYDIYLSFAVSCRNFVAMATMPQKYRDMVSFFVNIHVQPTLASQTRILSQTTDITHWTRISLSTGV